MSTLDKAMWFATIYSFDGVAAASKSISRLDVPHRPSDSISNNLNRLITFEYLENRQQILQLYEVMALVSSTLMDHSNNRRQSLQEKEVAALEAEKSLQDTQGQFLVDYESIKSVQCKQEDELPAIKASKAFSVTYPSSRVFSNAI